LGSRGGGLRDWGEFLLATRQRKTAGRRGGDPGGEWCVGKRGGSKRRGVVGRQEQRANPKKMVLGKNGKWGTGQGKLKKRSP